MTNDRHRIYHFFCCDLATDFNDVALAILIERFKIWIGHNKGTGIFHIHGRTWTKKSLDHIAYSFPYWSKRQISKLIDKAVRKKILRKECLDDDVGDRTMWYAFEDEEEFLNGENQ